MIKIYNLGENAFATFNVDGCEFLIDTKKNGFENYTHNVYVNKDKMVRDVIMLQNFDNFSRRAISSNEACAYAVAKVYEDLIKHKVKVCGEHIELFLKELKECRIIKYVLTDDVAKPKINVVYKLPIEYATNNEHHFFIDSKGNFLALKNDIRFAYEPYTNYLFDNENCVFIFGENEIEVKEKFNKFIDCLKDKNNRKILDQETKLNITKQKISDLNNNLENQKL